MLIEVDSQKVIDRMKATIADLSVKNAILEAQVETMVELIEGMQRERVGGEKDARRQSGNNDGSFEGADEDSAEGCTTKSFERAGRADVPNESFPATVKGKA